MYFKRTPAELKEFASLWWPSDLVAEVASISPNVLLRRTFPEFREFLSLGPSKPEEFTEYILSWSLGSNMLLKHLMIFVDFAGEPVQRLHSERSNIFPQPSDELAILWNDRKYHFNIGAFTNSGKSMSNSRLKIDGPSLLMEEEHNPLSIALSTVLCYGAFAEDQLVAEKLAKCNAAMWFSRGVELHEHLEQRYLDVNRSVAGAQSNSLGQLLQVKVKEAIERRFTEFDRIQTNGTIEVKGEKITSDILITRGDRAVGIEVAFQETTNSVIERKGTDAQKRQQVLNSIGVASAYVLDGIGNFQRDSAIRKICSNSDCTIAYSAEEFDVLVEFIAAWLKG